MVRSIDVYKIGKMVAEMFGMVIDQWFILILFTGYSILNFWNSNAFPSQIVCDPAFPKALSQFIQTWQGRRPRFRNGWVPYPLEFHRTS